jgi:hypothetical protein
MIASTIRVVLSQVPDKMALGKTFESPESEVPREVKLAFFSSLNYPHNS